MDINEVKSLRGEYEMGLRPRFPYIAHSRVERALFTQT